jgi:hypothetical protein
MPQVPYYRGSVASGGVVHAPPPQASLLQALASGGGDAFGSLIGRAFYNPENDPRAQQAAYYKAQTEAERAKTQRTAAGDRATADFGRDSAIVRGFRQPETPVDMTQEAIAGAYQRAIAAGADPKQITPLLKAFALSLGGDASDQMGVRVNSIMDGDYLGKGESPSLARQEALIDDEQRQELEVQKGDLALKKYGFDTQASTSRANNAADNATSRANNSSTVGASMRGQDLDFESGRRNRITDVYSSVFNNERDNQGAAKVVSRVERNGKGAVTKRVDQRSGPAPRRPAAAGGGKDPFPGIADGQVVTQGGKSYRRRGDQMVPVS